MNKTNPAPNRPLQSDTDAKMNLAAADKLRKASRQEIDEVYKMLDSSDEGICFAGCRNDDLSRLERRHAKY